MKLSNLWKEKDVTLSFEAFPPKKDSDFDSVATAVEKIAQLKPDFMSVTYGAGGGTSTYTSQIAQIVQAQGVTALAHLTCVSSDRERIHHELDALKEAGIEFAILSNNRSPVRVEKFCKPLKVGYVGHAGKPGTRGFHEAMARYGVNARETAMLGDKLLTDTLGARRSGVLMLMVEPRGGAVGAWNHVLHA